MHLHLSRQLDGLAAILQNSQRQQSQLLKAAVWRPLH
jgi:hypothetical protein